MRFRRIHAGIIEPGISVLVFSVRDSCLRGQAWNVTKGVEKLFESKNIDEQVKLAERYQG
jgi:hypothetical protein